MTLQLIFLIVRVYLMKQNHRQVKSLTELEVGNTSAGAKLVHLLLEQQQACRANRVQLNPNHSDTVTGF